MSTIDIQACTERGFVVMTRDRKETSDHQGYQGATVMEAKRGAWLEPVACLDYAALWVARTHLFTLSIPVS